MPVATPKLIFSTFEYNTESKLNTLCTDYEMGIDDALTHALFLGLNDSTNMALVRSYLEAYDNG